MPMPKTAHSIWFGEELPGWARENIATLRALHPSWEIVLWRELPEAFPAELRAIICGQPWQSSRSDIFRYWILANYGGVFLDTDILCLRPLDPLCEHKFFLAPCQPEGHTRPHLNCALMGSEPHSPAIERVLAECVALAALNRPPKRTAYGPDLLTRLFTAHPAEVRILPSHYFYAIPDRSTAHRFWHADTAERVKIIAPYLPTRSDEEPPYAVHLWGVEGSSWRTAEETATASSSGS